MSRITDQPKRDEWVEKKIHEPRRRVGRRQGQRSPDRVICKSWRSGRGPIQTSEGSEIGSRIANKGAYPNATIGEPRLDYQRKTLLHPDGSAVSAEVLDQYVSISPVFPFR